MSPIFGIGCRLSQKGEANGAETLEGMTQGSDGHGMYGQSYHQNLDDSIASMTVLC